MVVFPLSISFLEILLIALLILFFLGGTRIAVIMRKLGKGVGNLRRDSESDIDDQPNQAEIDKK